MPGAQIPTELYLNPAWITGMIRTYPGIKMKGEEIFGKPKPHPSSIIQKAEIKNVRSSVYHNAPGAKANLQKRSGIDAETIRAARLYDKKRITMKNLKDAGVLANNGQILVGKEAYEEYIRNELEDIVTQYKITKEFERWDFLDDGKATFEYDDGTSQEVDVGFHNDQTRTVSTSWATATTDIIADHDIAMYWFEENVGDANIKAYCGKNVMRNIFNNTKLQHGAGALIRNEILRTNTIQDFLGAQWFNHFTRAENAAGVMTSFVADNKVVYIAEGIPGAFREYSCPNELEMLQTLNKSIKLQNMGNGIVAYMEVLNDPPAIEIFVECNYMPLIRQPKAVYVLTTIP
jgi:hypothetical protein